MTTLTIGKLAKSCNVRVDTIRYYEKIGLLLPLNRTESGYRVYSSDSIERLRFVRKTQSLGFKLEEIKELLALPEKPATDCADVRKFARDKIIEVEEHIADLLKIKNCLKELADFCPGEGKPLSECNILQYFYGDES